MAKSVKKAATKSPAKAPRKRSPAKPKNEIVTAKEEVPVVTQPAQPEPIPEPVPIPKVIERPTALAPTSPQKTPWWAYVIRTPWVWVAAAALLFFLIIGIKNCNQNRHIVQTKKGINDTLRAVAITKQSLDSINNVLAKQDSLTKLAVQVAEAAHAETVKKEQELAEAKTTLYNYLGKQKTASDYAKKVIQSGTSRQLDSLWKVFLLTKE